MLLGYSVVGCGQHCRTAEDRGGLMEKEASLTKAMWHFVGFKNDRYWNAVKVFGEPDFIHRFWDRRAIDEITPDDIVVFADGDEHSPVHPYAFDDSANF